MNINYKSFLRRFFEKPVICIRFNKEIVVETIYNRFHTVFLLVIIFILSGFLSLISAQRHHIAIVYSEAVNDTTALEIDNYIVFDAELNEIQVLNVWQVTDSIYAVVVNFLPYKSAFTIRAENIKDLAGIWINENNSAWFYFDGYDFNEPQPYLILE